jgi:hypothetical protein
MGYVNNFNNDLLNKYQKILKNRKNYIIAKATTVNSFELLHQII